jgi:hypothetical protein
MGCGKDRALLVQGLCVEAPCGGGHGAFRSPPWNSTDCPVLRPTWYENTPQKSPINDVSGCLYFHNLVTDGDGTQHCEPCGTPGKLCQEECVMGIAFAPSSSDADGLGEFQFLDDSIRTSGPLVRPSHVSPTEHVGPDRPA